MGEPRDRECPKPRLIRRENGGWLAVSPKGAFVRIGVAAWQADDAENKFAREWKEWMKLLPEPVSGSRTTTEEPPQKDKTSVDPESAGT